MEVLMTMVAIITMAMGNDGFDDRMRDGRGKINIKDGDF